MLAVVGLTYWRLYYGIDFTDESFYVAVPYRLVLGAHPFVDETAVAQQLAAILIYPFVRAYYAVAGVTGIVLFLRHLQFVFSLLVSLAVVFALRSVLETRRAVLVGVAVVAFVPFDIHGLSYDTLGSGLFTAGCFLGFKCLREQQRRATRILAGLCHGLAVFVYPPLLAAVAAAYLIRLKLARGRARRSTLGWDLPALALPLAGIAALVAAVGPHRFIADYKHSRTSSVKKANLHKLVTIAAHEWSTLSLWYLLLPALLLLALTWRRQRDVARLVLLALPLLVLPPKLSSYTASLGVRHALRLAGAAALPRSPATPGSSSAARRVLAAGAARRGNNQLHELKRRGQLRDRLLPAAIVTSVFLIWSLDQPGRGDLGPTLLSRLAIARR